MKIPADHARASSSETGIDSVSTDVNEPVATVKTISRPRQWLRIAVWSIALLIIGGLGRTLWTLERAASRLRNANAVVDGSAGTLFICGGGSLAEPDMAEFVQLAGGTQARLIVIPGDRVPAVRKEDYATRWRNGGIGEVTILGAESREQAIDPRFAAPIRQATAVWFGGGRQTYLAELYQGTPVEHEVTELLHRGGIVGGTSAGASIMTRVMVAGGSHTPVESHGMDLLPDAIIDQHFFQRNRMNRLMSLVRSHPDLLGLGIDEGTAAVIDLKRGRVAVLGRSFVAACTHSGFDCRVDFLHPGDVTTLADLKAGYAANSVPFEDWLSSD